jgi:hypothetical protein
MAFLKVRRIGRHGDHLPDVPADASARTETFGAVKVAPMAVRDRCDLRPRFIPNPEPVPFTSTPRFDRTALHSMRQDCRRPEDGGLPIFASLIRDKWALHQLATRAPHNAEGDL